MPISLKRVLLYAQFSQTCVIVGPFLSNMCYCMPISLKRVLLYSVPISLKHVLLYAHFSQTCVIACPFSSNEHCYRMPMSLEHMLLYAHFSRVKNKGKGNIHLVDTLQLQGHLLIEIFHVKYSAIFSTSLLLTHNYTSIVLHLHPHPYNSSQKFSTTKCFN